MRLDVSHHYGKDSLTSFGCVFLEVDPLRKLIFMWPGQMHPEHSHPKKVEQFRVLYGDFTLEFPGGEARMTTGDVVTIRAGALHSFSTADGCIVEEIASCEDVSHYTDDVINATSRADRKTIIDV